MKLEWWIIVLLLMAIAISAHAQGIAFVPSPKARGMISMVGSHVITSDDCDKVIELMTGGTVTLGQSISKKCVIEIYAIGDDPVVINVDGRPLTLRQKYSMAEIEVDHGSVVRISGDFK